MQQASTNSAERQNTVATRPQWEVERSAGVDYLYAKESMEQRVAAIRTGDAAQKLWLLEHPPLYTAGTSAKPSDMLDGGRFPVYEAGRGGQYTYHGPGQRVGYVMMDLSQRKGGKHNDLKAFVHDLEQWLINTLAAFDIQGEVRDGRVGVWVKTPSVGEAKIAAIGIRVRKWVTFHGIALNVCPDLTHYAGIVPCGIQEFGVTSLHALGVDATMEQVDAVLIREFNSQFDVQCNESAVS